MTSVVLASSGALSIERYGPEECAGADGSPPSHDTPEGSVIGRMVPPAGPDYGQNLVLIANWEPILGVQALRLGVRRIKTKSGSCSPASRSLLLDQELAKKPPELLEYIVVHELMHLLEPTHSPCFLAQMDQHMPESQFYRVELNRLPVGHEE
jgi:hypothetical protein